MSTSSPIAGSFAVPRTPVSPQAAEVFGRAEKTPRVFAAALVPETSAVRPEELVPPSARLSVDVPAELLRRLKIRAIESRVTVRELVLQMLQREGL